MGIARYYNMVAKSATTSAAVNRDLKTKISAKHFYLDFNAMIHPTSRQVASDVNNFMKLVLADTPSRNNKVDTNLIPLFKQWEMEPQTFDTPEEVVKKFQEHFTDAHMDEMVIGQVVADLSEIIDRFFEQNCLEHIYVSIDGVPSKGKMLEQRQRRYMGAVQVDYVTYLLDNQYTEYLKSISNTNYLMAKYKITWNTTKLTPGTGFMRKLLLRLRHVADNRLEYNFAETQKKIKTMIISGTDEYGEGEKKIVELIKVRKYKPDDKIVVYSPDADMIVLLQLLTTNTPMYILRYDQQESAIQNSNIYGLIDIDEYRNVLADYIIKINKKKYDPIRINYDIACFSTVMGNDFVPKINTVGNDSDIGRLLDCYAETLKEVNKYMVQIKNDKYRLSFTFWNTFIKNLLVVENEFIINGPLMDMVGPYNLPTILHVFSDVNVTAGNIRELDRELRMWYGQMKGDMGQNQPINKYITDSIRMLRLKKALKISDVDMLTIADEEVPEIIIKNMDGDRYPSLNYSLNPPVQSLKTFRHAKNIKGMNKYQLEVYKFENALEEYKTVLDMSNSKWGPETITNFYKTNFNINIIKPNGDITDEAKKIMSNYMEAILWVFDYYFNGDARPNIWYYDSESAPLLKHLYQYQKDIDRKTFIQVHDNLENFIVTDISTYFNPVEQFAYVCPMVHRNKILLPKEYREFFKTEAGKKFIKTYYPDTDRYVEDIYNSRFPVVKQCTLLNCVDSRFLTRCKLEGVEKPDRKTDIEFIKDIRKVKLGTKTLKITQSGPPILK
jgi:5'-3' exonuclease